MTLIGDLLSKLNDNGKSIVRSIEKVQKKLANIRNAVIFNETCLEQGLLPKYYNIYIYIVHSGLQFGSAWQAAPVR